MRRGEWEGSWHHYQSLIPSAQYSSLSPPHLLFPEPQITSPPYDVWNVTGQDVIFGCEVFAYPMASIEWRKDGTEMLLPGDDPHISVQVSGWHRGW